MESVIRMPQHTTEPCTAQESLRRYEFIFQPYLSDELMLWACPRCGRAVVHFYLTPEEHRLFQVESALDGFSTNPHRCPPITCTEFECWPGPERRPERRL